MTPYQKVQRQARKNHEQLLHTAGIPWWLIIVFIGMLIWLMIGCTKTNDPCDRNFQYEKDSIGFMESGTLGELGSFYTIQKIDPKDWDNNLYFTKYGGFSYSKVDALKVPIEDSCSLKNRYFEYLDSTGGGIIVIGDSYATTFYTIGESVATKGSPWPTPKPKEHIDAITVLNEMTDDHLKRMDDLYDMIERRLKERDDIIRQLTDELNECRGQLPVMLFDYTLQIDDTSKLIFVDDFSNTSDSTFAWGMSSDTSYVRYECGYLLITEWKDAPAICPKHNPLKP